MVIEPRGEYWVTFDVAEEEAAALEDATGRGDDRVGGVITKEPSDGTALVVFEVVADDDGRAWQIAEEIYEQLRGLAHLENAPPLGGTVTRLKDALATVPPAAPPSPRRGPIRATPPRFEQLLDKAEALLLQDEHEQTVVVAQTACEVAIGDAMRRLIAQRAPFMQSAMEGFINRQFGLSTKRMVDLWHALSGDDIRHTPGQLWERYEKHRGLRTRVAHEGSEASHQEAEASLKVAREVCDYVIPRSFSPAI
jgi:hypothetical protein